MASVRESGQRSAVSGVWHVAGVWAQRPQARGRAHTTLLSTLYCTCDRREWSTDNAEPVPLCSEPSGGPVAYCRTSYMHLCMEYIEVLYVQYSITGG